MKCPVCPDADLLISERQGIEIDYCPSCRGVWLDRGELDKIIERSLDVVTPVSRPASRDESRRGGRDDDDRGRDDRYRDDRYRDDEYYKKKKKKDFFSDLFDF